MLTACYLLNRVPNKRNKVTPYELWYKKKPNLNYLRIWDCRVVVRLPESKKKSLGERGIDCIFIGYAEHSKAYRETESSEMTLDEPMELRKSKRKRKPKSFGPDFQLYLIEGSRDEVSTLYPYCFNVENDQKTFDEAMKSQDVAFWKEAINDEMDSIMVNNTWVLANLPPGYKPLGYKWIFKKKMKVDETIEKFKARLVIQTFRQRPGIDYFDTYAPIARILTIRLLIDLASIHNLLIHQMDVKIVFLNGDLDEEVYMKQLEGFIMPGNEHKSHYIEKVLKKFNCFDCTPVSTPMDPSVKIMPNTLAKAYSQMYNGKSRHLGV
ncbi:Retrovirus-related Pol polyprotein from transposon TNT 1-94 [Sesamum angolense]|uniref:Retrovirus-related Pol polyprotein from transposon TNT 1-94 n=1 Tax=Sesamum angolense TaxID=2727404 RepID=A0AAE1WQS5_9LAMI|nr:Retrovirus-related Pol polyprotein from transposon TNT 1-94 [Sesamum angolense]